MNLEDLLAEYRMNCRLWAKLKKSGSVEFAKVIADELKILRRKIAEARQEQAA